MQTPRSGLGRGLAALIPNAERVEHAGLTDVQQLMHNLALSGLDQIAAQSDPDVLAFVHLPAAGSDDETQLFLRRPTFESLSATRAYRLLGRFERAVTSEAAEGTFRFDDTAVLFIRTAGPRSVGVHFIGQSTVPDSRTLGMIRATSRSFASISNQFASGPPTGLPPFKLVVELDAARTQITATVGEDASARSGWAEADDGIEALATALLDATGRQWQFREGIEVPINDMRAVLVLYTDETGRPRPGFVLSGDDVMQAAATAALRAIYGR